MSSVFLSMKDLDLKMKEIKCLDGRMVRWFYGDLDDFKFLKICKLMDIKKAHKPTYELLKNY
jgi:hypothetical protein